MTVLHKMPHNGELVEYRRDNGDPTILRVEQRALRSDGTPHDDRWFPVSDSELSRLDRYTDVLDILDPR